MTIASEISRLQTAKANMKTAIVNKWVSVADSVSLSNYCDCINAISSWWSIVEVLVVWWWWAWTCCFWWWGGWGVVRTPFPISWWSATITVWAGGVNKWCAWCQSKIVSWDNSVCATWWTAWWWEFWWNSWKWYINSGLVQAQNNWWTWCCDSRWAEYVWWGWGWWAWWAWCSATTYWCGVDWWAWLYWYWWWGWGWSWACLSRTVWVWIDWWGTWENRCSKRNSCNANNYWWGGWWWQRGTACWCQWVVEICYSQYWMSWFSSATWWNCCFYCNWMRVHRFTSNWTFTIVS